MSNCWNCIHADECQNWLDIAPYICFCETEEKDEANSGHAILGLVKGRHTLPDDCEGYVFEEIIDPTNVEVLEIKAMRFLYSLDIFKLDLYVTGLSVALVAVINVCQRLNIELVLWHFDRDTGKYFCQKVR